jgi:hypothetical protein
VSSHLQRSHEELEQLRAWYQVRDVFFGQNGYKQDIKKALELVAACKHPDAVWLTNLFAGRDVNTRDEAVCLFLCCQDSRALCFAALLEGSVDAVLRAADLGDAYAQGEMASRMGGEERFQWAKKSAAQGERHGCFRLAYCFRHGIGCKPDVDLAQELFLIAADLGDVYAMRWINGPERLAWLGKAAVCGEPRDFLDEFAKEITREVRECFLTGRILKGQIDSKRKTIFGTKHNFGLHINAARKAVRFYELQLLYYRKAVDCWTLVGLRNGVVKDIRKLIGRLIWDAREEAKYLEG